MRRSTWKAVKELLRELCHYLPDAHPGQRALAERLGTSQSVVQRLVVKAEEAGFIERTDHVYGGKPRAGTSYRLTFVATRKVTQFATQSGSEKKSLTSSETGVGFAPAAPGRKRRDSRALHARQPNRFDGYCAVCSHPVGAYHGFLHGPHPVHRQCDSGVPDWPRLKEYLMTKHGDRYGDPSDWGTAFGADPEEPLPTHSPPPAKPQVRLAKHFEQHWNESMFKRKEWRGVYRGIDLGPAIGYISTKMLDAGFNEEHIALMIDEFFVDLLTPEGTLMMRDGQTCWQLFTGWWGRNPVEDPVPIRKRRERIDAMSKKVADHIASITKPPPPPPRRRVLTPRKPVGYGHESQVGPPDGDTDEATITERSTE